MLNKYSCFVCGTLNFSVGLDSYFCVYATSLPINLGVIMDLSIENQQLS